MVLISAQLRHSNTNATGKPVEDLPEEEGGGDREGRGGQGRRGKHLGRGSWKGAVGREELAVGFQVLGCSFQGFGGNVPAKPPDTSPFKSHQSHFKSQRYLARAWSRICSNRIP